MTVRERIMDKYWMEFLKSEDFTACPNFYQYAQPLEATFWWWFAKRYKAPTKKVKKLEDYL